MNYVAPLGASIDSMTTHPFDIDFAQSETAGN